MAKFAAGNAIRIVPGETVPELDWELLYDLHAPKLRRVIQRKVGAALVDDVLQETFLRAFKNRATIDPARPIEPWLITIALRTATDLQRLQLRTLETVDVNIDEVEVVASNSVEDELLSRARRMGIKHAFASLNTRQRRLLQLVTLEGMSYEGAAHAERMTPDAVKSVLARARTNFKTSYVGFEREYRLFGGAMVLGVLNRLRRRLQRYQAFVDGHLAGVGAAATTVAVVAVAVVPVMQQSPTSASEPVATTGNAQASGTEADPVVTAAPATSKAVPVRAGPRPPIATPAGDAQIQVADDGRATSATVSGGAGGDAVWTFDGITVTCDANPTTEAQCSALRSLPGLPQAP